MKGQGLECSLVRAPAQPPRPGGSASPMWGWGCQRRHRKLALLLWVACLTALLPRMGRAEFRGTVSADGFREPMKAGCWGCNSEPGVILGTIQYGVTATDSQLSEGASVPDCCKSSYACSEYAPYSEPLLRCCRVLRAAGCSEFAAQHVLRYRGARDRVLGSKVDARN